MVCGAKRIRSLYLPWMTGVPPKLSTKTPPKDWPRSPLSMARLCAFAEQTSLPRPIQSQPVVRAYCGLQGLPREHAARAHHKLVRSRQLLPLLNRHSPVY